MKQGKKGIVIKKVISDDVFIYGYDLYYEEQEKTLNLSMKLATLSNVNLSYINFSVELQLVKEYPLYTIGLVKKFM